VAIDPNLRRQIQNVENMIRNNTTERTASLTELHHRVSASGVAFCSASSQVSQALFRGGDLAESGVLAGLGEASFGVGGHLLEDGYDLGQRARAAGPGCGPVTGAAPCPAGR
jgi:hypothetical protein